MKTLAINGSYRDNGAIDQALSVLRQALADRGQPSEEVRLRDTQIEFCTNCRQCCQQPGPDPGFCPLDDDMPELIEKIEESDVLIFAAPVNFGAVTALFKQFLERLICYGYWPYDAPYPKNRKKKLSKKALLITSSAMPGLMARFSTNAMHSLNYAAKTCGARAAKKIFIGFAQGSPETTLARKTVQRLDRTAQMLSQAS